MYRVDVYASEGSEGDNKIRLLPPAYACLGTGGGGNDEDNGRLFTVGRKNATFILDKDKSCSRDHLHLHLMSNNDGDDNNNNKDNAAARPSSKEEKDCCNKSPLNMALKVLNLGKFGTTVLAMAPVKEEVEEIDDDDDEKKKDNNNKPSNDDDGSDTEDESQKKEDSALPTASTAGLFSLPEDIEWKEKTKEIAKKILKDKSHKIVAFSKLNAKESKPIPGNATTVVLQCGQNGSLVVLTKLNLQIFPSGWPAANKKVDFKNRLLYELGAQLVEDDVEDTIIDSFFEAAVAANNHKQNGIPNNNNEDSDNDALPSALPPSGYLITPKKDTQSKPLVAWNLNVPLATIDFLEALLARKEPQDPWPNHEEYDPPIKMPPAKEKELKELADQDFWKTTKGSPKLWQSCTFLSTTANHQVEHLVRAAGSTILKVYDMEEDDAKASIQKLLEDPDKKDGIFSSASGGRKKIIKWIKEQNIPHLSAKKITSTFCQQELLHDEKEDRFIEGKVVEAEKEPAKEEEPPAKEAEATKPDSDSDSDETVDESQTKPKQKVSEPEVKSSKSNKEGAAKPQEGAKYEGSGDEKTKPEKEKQTDSTKASKRRRDDNREDEEANKKDRGRMEQEEKQQEGSENQTKRSRASQSQKKRKNSKDDEEDGEAREPETKRSRSSQSESQPHSQRNVEPLATVQEEDSMVLDDSPISEQERRPTSKKRGGKTIAEPGTAKLEMTEDGWLVAAPRAREAYFRPDAVLEVKQRFEEEGNPMVVAPTLTIGGLQKRSYDPNRCIAGTQTGIRHKKADGKDFKRFKKNKIVKGPSTLIELRAVQPKESSRLRELEEEFKDIESQQRQADELFKESSKGKRQTKLKTTKGRRRS